MLPVDLVTVMGLVNIMGCLCLLGNLRSTPIKFLFDLEDPSETSSRGQQTLVTSPSSSPSTSSYQAINMENNEARQTRRLSGMLGSHHENNGAQLVR